MKRTIEIEDCLQDCVDSAIEQVKEELINYLKENKPDKVPCLNNDLDYSGVIHEIVDGAVPISTYSINCAMFLHGNEIEQAFDDAGIGSKDDKWPISWQAAAIYCYIENQVQDWFQKNSQEIFEEWQNGPEMSS